MTFPEVAPGLDGIVAAHEPRMNARPVEWWNQPWAPGKWRRREVLGHLIDSAANNHVRFTRAMIEPSVEARGYDADACVRVQGYATAPLALTIALFCSYNRMLSHVLARVPAARLATPCRIGSSGAVTLEHLAVDYVAHLEHHLRQIFKSLDAGRTAE